MVEGRVVTRYVASVVVVTDVLVEAVVYEGSLADVAGGLVVVFGRVEVVVEGTVVVELIVVAAYVVVAINNNLINIG